MAVRRQANVRAQPGLEAELENGFAISPSLDLSDLNRTAESNSMPLCRQLANSDLRSVRAANGPLLQDRRYRRGN